MSTCSISYLAFRSRAWLFFPDRVYGGNHLGPRLFLSSNSVYSIHLPVALVLGDWRNVSRSFLHLGPPSLLCVFADSFPYPLSLYHLCTRIRVPPSLSLKPLPRTPALTLLSVRQPTVRGLLLSSGVAQSLESKQQVSSPVFHIEDPAAASGPLFSIFIPPTLFDAQSMLSAGPLTLLPRLSVAA